MHTTAFEAQQLAKGIVDGMGSENTVTTVLCPPFPYLAVVGDMLKGSSVALGAQNMYPEAEGAFTGEVSPAMLLDLGCKYVILGHSERRHKLGESDAFINRKVRCALDAGLDVILCVGETLEQRSAGPAAQAWTGRRCSRGFGPPEHRIRTSLGDRRCRPPCNSAASGGGSCGDSTPVQPDLRRDGSPQAGHPIWRQRGRGEHRGLPKQAWHRRRFGWRRKPEGRRVPGRRPRSRCGDASGDADGMRRTEGVAAARPILAR